jgi:hypothetical protein
MVRSGKILNMSKKLKNRTCDSNSRCCSPNEIATTPIEGSIVRRDFLKSMGLATGGLMMGFPAIGLNNSKAGYTIPTDKGLSAKWYKSLYERGKAEVYS